MNKYILEILKPDSDPLITEVTPEETIMENITLLIKTDNDEIYKIIDVDCNNIKKIIITKKRIILLKDINSRHIG